MRHSMRIILQFFLFYLSVILVGCKSRQGNFIKTEKATRIVLTGTTSPHINFVLESKDTIIFSIKDIVDKIDERIQKEMNGGSYALKDHLIVFNKSLKGLNADTTVYQSLAAVGMMTITGNLDGWLAHKLLLEGKAIIAFRDNREPAKELIYVYEKDILGGERGSFYANERRLVYTTVISLGE